jgi:hypothetical protein
VVYEGIGTSAYATRRGFEVKERLFRGDVFEHGHAPREDFDPTAEGQRYGLSLEVSAALWEQVRRAATSRDGLCDEQAARAQFAKLAELVAKRGGQLGPAPFHWTHVDVASGRVPSDNPLEERVAGKTTRVLSEEAAHAHVAEGAPRRTTLVASQATSEVSSPDETRAFFGRYLRGGNAARAKLERAIAERDHHAAVIAIMVLKQDLRLARRHFDNGLAHDDELRASLAALEGQAEPLLARLPNMNAGGRSWDLWGSSSAEWRAATGQAAREEESSEAGTRVDEPRASERLPASLHSRMARVFGRRFDNVELYRNSSEVQAGQRAMTRGQHIHLERGAELTAPRGELVIAHELAHVAQQDGRGARVGTRQELEREASRAAMQAVRGQTARISLRAEPTAAYGFSEDHEHNGELEHSAGDTTRADESAHSTVAHPPESVGDKHSSTEPAASDDAEGDREAPALEAVPAEDAPPTAAQVGGGPAAKPHKEPPHVAQVKPELGVTELRGVRPDQIGPVLGAVHAAANADVAGARAAQHANPPKLMSTGAAIASATGAAGGHAVAPRSSMAGKGAAPKQVTADRAGASKDAAATVAAAATPAAVPSSTLAAKDAAARPVKAEIPNGEAEKKATQGAAVEQQKTTGEAVTYAASAIASWFGSWNSWFGHQEDASAQGAKLSNAESRQMATSIDQIPATAVGVSTDLGPAPSLAMEGEARARADRDRAAFEAKTAAAENQGRAESRVPMGEDELEAPAPVEELTAVSVGASVPPATPAVAMPTLASSPSEEVGIVAQEQHGTEIDAALTKASADIGTERAGHTAQEARVRAESDAKLRDLKSQADADQAAARQAAHSEAGAARAQWQAELAKQGADARRQADRKVTEGMAQVEAEEAKANAEARRHIEEGKRRAEEEKQKGEKEAVDAKEQAKHKSSSFWGWVSSKAKAALDGVKKAVSSAIDACRRAVKAVIEGAKKLAAAAIELARKAINATIRAIGQALAAISEVMLAAFPELKARFQGLIHKAVDKATATVNRLADGLKQAVQKALDALGATLDQALQLLEKGIHAIIDAVNEVVQGAIQAARAVVGMLGTWAKLIKDVATGPGAWLGKLGAAIVDGIKNHLWSAFKTTVVEWFKSKVFELLGVGGVVLQLLLDGGITKEHIIEMAMDALTVAIPAALVAILVEKLVAMIVPAAGAVMAIIGGLQAAWGTISRIVAAFSAFVGFLLAVKSGTAGPLFAGLLATAAVVVLDFVASWLLKKLASAARKVGAKLKGMAEKFKAKRKAKKDAKAKPHHDEHEAKKEHKHDDEGKHDAKKREDEKKQEKLNKAVQELPPKIAAALAKRPSKLAFRAKLLWWRTQYGLTALRLEKKGGGQFEIEAVVNPKAMIAGGYEYERDELLKMLQRVGERVLHENPDAMDRAKQRAEDMGLAHAGARAQELLAPRTTEERFAIAAHRRVRPPGREAGHRTYVDHGDVHTGGPVRSVTEVPRMRGQRDPGDELVLSVNESGGASRYHEYSEIAQLLTSKGITEQQLGMAMEQMSRGRPPPAYMRGSEKPLGELMGLWFGTEPARDPRNAVFSMMRVEEMQKPTRDLGLDQVFRRHPAEMPGHVEAVRALNADLSGDARPKPSRSKAEQDRRVNLLRRRQLAQLRSWFKMQIAGGRTPVSNSLPDLERFVEDMVRRFVHTYEGPYDGP